MLQLFAAVSSLAFAGAARFIAPIILKGWAKENILYTLAPEMKGLVAITGGKFHHAILASDSYHLNDPRKRWFNPSLPPWEVLPGKKDDRWPMIREFGGYWIGLPWFRSLKRYQFDWNEMGKDAAGKPCIKNRKEETPYWFAMDFEYAMAFDSVTSEGLPVRLQILLTVRITNPRKALFETDDWLLRVTAAVERIVKDYAAGHRYAELRGEAGHNSVVSGSDYVSKPVIALSDKLLDEDPAVPYQTGTKGRYGITISAADLRSVELSGKAAAEHEETSILEYNADRKAAAKRVEADGTADALRKVGTAEAEMTERKGEAAAKAASAKLSAYAKEPQLAAAMMQADAMASPGEGKTIFVTPNVEEILGKVFNQKPGSTK